MRFHSVKSMLNLRFCYEWGTEQAGPSEQLASLVPGDIDFTGNGTHKLVTTVTLLRCQSHAVTISPVPEDKACSLSQRCCRTPWLLVELHFLWQRFDVWRFGKLNIGQSWGMCSGVGLHYYYYQKQKQNKKHTHTHKSVWPLTRFPRTIVQYVNTIRLADRSAPSGCPPRRWWSTRLPTGWAAADHGTGQRDIPGWNVPLLESRRYIQI